jgi:hypothetical protein
LAVNYATQHHIPLNIPSPHLVLEVHLKEQQVPFPVFFWNLSRTKDFVWWLELDLLLTSFHHGFCLMGSSAKAKFA